MPIFQAGIHILVELMNKEIKYYEYVTYNSCILYLLPILSKAAWEIPLWQCEFFHIFMDKYLQVSFLEFVLSFFLHLLHISLNFCPWWSLTQLCSLICFSIHYSEKLFLHLTTYKFEINFFSSIKKNSILWNGFFFPHRNKITH